MNKSSMAHMAAMKGLQLSHGALIQERNCLGRESPSVKGQELHQRQQNAVSQLEMHCSSKGNVQVEALEGSP